MYKYIPLSVVKLNGHKLLYIIKVYFILPICKSSLMFYYLVKIFKSDDIYG